MLSEVKLILSNESFDDIIWIGDMNWDKNRKSEFSQVMENLVQNVGLVDVWDKFPVTYTHIHTKLKSVSTIDRILINKRLVPLIVDARVLHFADNPSRHSPILLKVDLDKFPANIQPIISQKKYPSWQTI